ncbi:GyrI-like domain-containing protein [bacterium]|nr:GyrI-like domain-containing protein [bacterium]
MLKIVVIVGSVLVVLGIVAVLFMLKGPDLSKYKYLQDPRIAVLPDVKVMEIPFEVSSDGLGGVYKALFKTYFKLKGVPKGPGMESPAARYENALDFDMDTKERETAFKNIIWKGSAAIPLSETISALPAINSQDNFIPRLTTWKYGETAEILHIGPYEKEAPTVNKLCAFIKAQGYEISGLHEEVYLRGPGMPFSKPENYQTIIRYPVKKTAE